MAHRRGSFRPRISDTQRRKKLWVGFNALASDGQNQGTDTTLLLSFQTPSSVIVGNVAESSAGFFFPTGKTAGFIDSESTLLRIRGSLELPKITQVANEYTVVAFGIGVLETGAATKGAAPNPASPTGAGWDGWMFYRSQYQGALDANAGIVDVKAMRKIQSGYSLVFVLGLHVTTDDGIPPAQSSVGGFFSARGLFLLP